MRIISRLLCIAAIFGAFSAKAADGSNIYLHLKTGEKVVFSFANRPVMTFGDDNSMTIEDKNKSVTTNAFDKLHKVTFNETTGIADAVADNNGKIQFTSPTGLTFIGFKTGTQVSVTSSNGITVMTATIDNDEPLTVSLDACPKGVYIVVADDVTYKIALK